MINNENSTLNNLILVLTDLQSNSYDNMYYYEKIGYDDKLNFYRGKVSCIDFILSYLYDNI